MSFLPTGYVFSGEPDYGFKLWLARRVCEKRGWIFSTFVADKDFVGGRLLANARRIAAFLNKLSKES